MGRLKNIGAIILFVGLLSIELNAQTEAPSWIDFAEKKESGKLVEATLSDYSYAGYHFSEKEIPDVSGWTRFDVTDYGALPNDTIFDDAAIRLAINAAIASDAPAVVYFPAGKYLVADEANANNPIIINRSNIVLKGAGSGAGGTEIYAEKVLDNPTDPSQWPWRFQFKADLAAIETKITPTKYKRIYRGDYTIEVASASNLEVGQTVELYHQGVENLEANVPGLSYNPIWNTGKRGVRTLEKHIVESIDGNKVTFVNPVQYTITAEYTGAELRKYYTIEEVGVEDILFTSGWKKSSQIYEHHANDFVDYAYRALAFENVKNGWIRNCEIRDWNESLMIEKCIGVTVKNLLISGKQGHTSYFARYSYGILFEDCRDIVPIGFKGAGGQGHGPGMRWSTVSTVFRNCKMMTHQSIDCHGYHPYSNLLDNVSGGCFRGNGGNEGSYPNSGPYMTFWNFIHASNYTNFTFNFWDLNNRKTHTYMKPLFIGFKSPGENINFLNAGLNELKGKTAYPKSLFDAQLQLRLYGAYMSASSSHAEHLPVNANDDSTQTNWVSGNNGAGEWLMLDLGMAEVVEEIKIVEVDNNIDEWKLEAWTDGAWETIITDNTIGENKLIALEDIITRKFRLTVVSMKTGAESEPARIAEFMVTKSTFIDTDNDGIADYLDADDDNDGTEDESDPNQNAVVVADDALSVVFGSSDSVNVLDNDDFVPGSNVSVTNLGTGTAEGVITIDESTGEIIYTPVAAEVGSDVTVDYEVCNNGVNPSVCSSATLTISVTEEINTSISDLIVDNALFTIYPNPARFDIYLDFGKNGNRSVSIYNSVGKLVWQKYKATDKTLKLVKGIDLNEGFYIVVVFDEKNRVQSRKLIII